MKIPIDRIYRELDSAIHELLMFPGPQPTLDLYLLGTGPADEPKHRLIMSSSSTEAVLLYLPPDVFAEVVRFGTVFVGNYAHGRLFRPITTGKMLQTALSSGGGELPDRVLGRLLLQEFYSRGQINGLPPFRLLPDQSLSPDRVRHWPKGEFHGFPAKLGLCEAEDDRPEMIVVRFLAEPVTPEAN